MENIRCSLNFVQRKIPFGYFSQDKCRERLFIIIRRTKEDSMKSMKEGDRTRQKSNKRSCLLKDLTYKVRLNDTFGSEIQCQLAIRTFCQSSLCFGVLT